MNFIKNFIKSLAIKKCISKKCKAYIEDVQYDAQVFLYKSDILNACSILSYIIYKYHTQSLLHIKEYPDLVYGTYVSRDQLFVVFKGSNTLADFINDSKFIQKEDDFNIPGEIHAGFYNILKDRFDEFIDLFKANKDCRIILTGHSLGAALATVLMGYCLANYPELDISMYNFGCPRVGDAEFCKFISDSERVTRVVNSGDIVTMLPIFDYAHPEKKVSIGKRLAFIPSIKAHNIVGYIQQMK